MDETSNIVELLDENNESVTFEHIMTLDYNGQEYVVLAPLEDAAGSGADLEEDEVVILRVEQDDAGEDYYTAIEDDDELEAVFSAVTEIYEKGFE